MKKKLFLLLFMVPALAMAAGYKDLLAGKKLTYEGADCAGISFSKNGMTAVMYNEQDPGCKSDFALRTKWLDDKTVMLVEKNRVNPESPPRVFVMKIQSITGNKIIVRDIWAGWGSYKDDIKTYIVEKIQ